MQPSDFDYHLPPELIATHPAPRRDASRLLRVPTDCAPFSHHAFHELPDLLLPGDCLVLNDSRVLPARLHAERPGGGHAELLLTGPHPDGAWEVLARPARKLLPSMRLRLTDGQSYAEVLPHAGEDPRTRRVRFEIAGGEPLQSFLERHGSMPLPPYIEKQRRALGEPSEQAGEDRERYQTVYARDLGSVAAPTAGLHFTPELLADLEARGIEIQRVTLHVGLGTFQPLPEGDLATARLHQEQYEVTPLAARAIEAARRDVGRRVVAVGTTSVRTLEACCAAHGQIVATRAATDIFIRPGFHFRAVDAMITNFHLPQSSLLMLVAAFAGRERILAAYHAAISANYRFYSYGDAMLLA